jgi:hypothetical protein
MSSVQVIIITAFFTALIYIFTAGKINKKLFSGNLMALFIVPAILGFFLIHHQANEISNGFSRQKWPTTTAKVIQSKVSGNRAFHPEISCIYRVKGKEYTFKTDLGTPGFGGKRSRRGTAEKIKNTYPVGSNVSVFYNPINPGEAVIRTGPYWTNYIQFALGITLWGVGLFGILIGITSQWPVFKRD